MTVASILKSKSSRLVKVDAELSISAVTEILHQNNIGAVLVMRDDELLGVLSDRGIVRAMALNPLGVRAMPAERAMKLRQHEAAPSTTLEEAMRIMTTNHVRYLPIFEASTLVGIVSIGDVVKSLLDQQSVRVDSLTAYISGA